MAYADVWRAMQSFTRARPFGAAAARAECLVPLGSPPMLALNADWADGDDNELWIVEHPPVYTQGQAGKAEHVLAAGDIPVVNTDRGGQVTYHGPGQLVVYTLLDLKSFGYGIRQLVVRLENAIVSLLADYGISAHGRRDAPGVYVGDAKIAALGLRVSRGYTYHGLALNINPELAPFAGINPCGYPGLEVTSLFALGVCTSTQQVQLPLLTALRNEIERTQ